MLFRFLYRGMTEVSWRLSFKALWLWCAKGLFALRAYRKRVKKGIQFPPFLFFSLTDACNLRCRGCWVHRDGVTKEVRAVLALPLPFSNPQDGRSAPDPAGAFHEKNSLVIQEGPNQLSLEAMQRIIPIAQRESVYFYTLLGGEPFLAPTMWEIIQKHPEAYFQVITNGMFLDPESVRLLKKFGNVSPLISIDGLEAENDARRGTGTYAKAIEGCRELQRQKMLYGVATVVTAKNFDEVVTEDYVQKFIDLGAMYLWFYVFRPVGADPAPELIVEKDKLLELRRRLLRLRRKMPIILIDTYWDAAGRAVCPASKGMSFVIDSQGGIDPCPPLTVVRETIEDNDGDFYKTVNESTFLRNVQTFIRDRYDGEKSQGCVIIDHPGELAEFFRREKVVDKSGRDFLAELDAATPKTSHYLPGEEIPEDYWVYRILKKTLFFGMGAYG